MNFYLFIQIKIPFSWSDLLTVSETANEPPQDEGNSFNSPRNLAMEATYINHNFSQQCLRMVRSPAPRSAGEAFPSQVVTFVLVSLRGASVTSFQTPTRSWRRTWTRARWRLWPTGMTAARARTWTRSRQQLTSVIQVSSLEAGRRHRPDRPL